MPVAPTASNAASTSLRVLEQAQVAARLEQVGADRDRAQAAGEQVRQVEGIRAAGERERHRPLEGVADPGREVDGHRVEGAARQVHRRVAVEDAAPVAHLERVRQLQPEGDPAPGGGRPQPLEHRHGVLPAEVVAEGLVGDRDVAVPELLVHDPADPLRAQQGRVALHRRVQAPLLDEVLRDPLDLVGRAAVHRRERHGVRDAGRDVDLADAGEAAGDDVDVRRQPGRRVGHGVEVPLHVGPADPLEVVADAHVEHDAGALAREAERAVEGVDEHPGAQVLVERLVDAQLLAPLDVVALVLDVDAGLVDLELVEGLDRLELDQPGAGEPRGDDVLGHLGVRAGGDAPRRVQLDAQLAAPEAVVRRGGRRPPTPGTPKIEPFRSSSVKTQLVSCSIERGWKRSDIGCSLAAVGRSEPGVQAGRLLPRLGADLVGVDPRRPAVGEDHLAVDRRRGAA